MLELVRARWGTTAHIVFLVFGLLTNIIVTSMLILGGAAVVNALTGNMVKLVNLVRVHSPAHRSNADACLPNMCIKEEQSSSVHVHRAVLLILRILLCIYNKLSILFCLLWL